MQRTCSGHLYDVLEVSPDSTTEDIKRQYRRLALRLHPDRTNGATTEQFQEVEEAHRILSDPEQRRLYDTVGREGLKKLGDFGVPDFLLSVKIIQPILATVVLFFALLLLTLVLIAVKLDGPRPTWSWAVVLLPIWVISPIFVLLGLACTAAAVKTHALEPLLVGVQLLLMVVIPAVACAALQGTLTPPSRAFIPCILYYVCGTLRALYGLVPSVYAARRRATEDILRGGDGSGTAVDLDSNASSNASNPDHSPLRSRTYWAAVAHELFEVACFTGFVVLCFRRSEQGPVRRDADDLPENFLSFWVVFSPLIVYFGVLVVLDFVLACAASRKARRQGGSASTHDSQFREADGDETVVVAVDEEPIGHRAGAYGSTGDSTASPARDTRESGPGRDDATDSPRRSLCARFAEALVAPFFHACGLYMVCMWASKMEVEYNKVDPEAVPVYPSVYAATFPLFFALAIPAMLLCCLSCALSSLLAQATANAGESEGPAAGEARGSDDVPVPDVARPSYNSTAQAGTSRDDFLAARRNLGVDGDAGDLRERKGAVAANDID